MRKINRLEPEHGLREGVRCKGRSERAGRGDDKEGRGEEQCDTSCTLCKRRQFYPAKATFDIDNLTLFECLLLPIADWRWWRHVITDQLIQPWIQRLSLFLSCFDIVSVTVKKFSNKS